MIRRLSAIIIGLFYLIVNWTLSSRIVRLYWDGMDQGRGYIEILIASTCCR